MNRPLLAAVVMVGLSLSAAGGYWLAMRSADYSEPVAATPSDHADAAGGRTVLYWYDPMYPQQRFDKPGKSPFMDMQLVPKYAGDGAAESGTVSINPQVVQNLGVRTAEAQSGSIEQGFEAVGSVAYNERGVVQLQARAAGFVEKLYARAPLDPVKKGAPLIQILFPEWAGAQEEYLFLRKAESQDVKQLADAARQRLVLLGMSEAEIAALDLGGKPHARFTLTSPITGVIDELGVREGMTVTAGSPLFRIVDLSTVWVIAEVPETQAAWIKPGHQVTARVAAYPGESFTGRIGAILPEVSAATRTLRTRIELANPGMRLKPGMYATLAFPGRSSDAVLVPSEAVIRTGRRDLVITALGEGKFRASEVEVAREWGGQTAIAKGLKPGDKVVLSGQFLIDSEASLSATVARLEGDGEQVLGTSAPTRITSHQGVGHVVEIDPRAGTVELDHEPIPTMQWPAMRMGFVAEDKNALAALKKGDVVEFKVKAEPDEQGNYVIEQIARRGGK
jgi:membrane fusion protein, copper/silver efflux system